MKQTINFYDFQRAFVDMGRAQQFTYEGLRVLFDWLEDYEDSTGEEIELDVIALCCDFSEDALEDVAENYGIESTVDGDILEYLHNNTIVCGETSDGTVVYQAF